MSTPLNHLCQVCGAPSKNPLCWICRQNELIQVKCPQCGLPRAVKRGSIKGIDLSMRVCRSCQAVNHSIWGSERYKTKSSTNQGPSKRPRTPNADRESAGRSGYRPCLKCDETFYSTDLARFHVCPHCREINRDTNEDNIYATPGRRSAL